MFTIVNMELRAVPKGTPIMKLHALDRPAAQRSVGRSVGRSVSRAALVAIALLALLAPAVAAQDAEESATSGDSTGWTLTEMVTDLTVPGFDGELGALVSAELTMSAEIDNRVYSIANDSNLSTDIFLATQLDLCAHPLAGEGYSTFEMCSVAGGRVTTTTEVSAESFQGVRPGDTASRRTPLLVSDSATAAVLDPAALGFFSDVDEVRLGVSSKVSHLTLGVVEAEPTMETFVDVGVSVFYSYIGLSLEVVDGAYVVTSTGTTTVSNVNVVHDTAGELCEINLLPPGQSQRCEVQGAEADGQSAVATGVAAINPAVSVTSGVSAGAAASIEVEVATNGTDADQGTGPKVRAGELVTWSYTIANTGSDDLVDVAVSDDRTGAICAAAVLGAGDEFTCSHEGRATSGQNSLIAKAVGTSVAGELVSDTDRSNHIVVNQDGTPTAELATGGGSATAPLSDAPYAGVEAPRLAFTGAETTVAAILGASSLVLGLGCVGVSRRLRREYDVRD